MDNHGLNAHVKVCSAYIYASMLSKSCKLGVRIGGEDENALSLVLGCHQVRPSKEVGAAFFVLNDFFGTSPRSEITTEASIIISQY